MHLAFDRTHKSLTEFPATGPIPNFIVLSGENGAGKSQVLEAIRDGAITGDWQPRTNAARMMSTAELSVTDDLPGAGETREMLVDRFEGQVRQFLTNHPTYPAPELIPGLHTQLIANNVLSATTISRIEIEAGKPLFEWSRAEFVAHTPVEVGFADPFGVAVGDLFSRYRQMLTMNGYNRWRATEFGETHHWLEDDAFVATNGPAPWDLLNRALSSVTLRYQFEIPEASLSATMTAPRLRDTGSGKEVGAGSLSSGEKTLLMIAMSFYSVLHRRNVISMPEILLLDEPDATLHPSMIRSLLTLLEHEFVQTHGVRVIMTTHSPTTVALAPDDSLFVMRRSGSPRFHAAASKDAALSALLEGVPSISINADHRRVVIVESPNDERLYTTMQGILGPRVHAERSLVFMPAGGNGRADGSAAVIGLVSDLRARGNVAVWGLVDRDDRTDEPHEHVLLDDSRYSIENVIVDPLSLGLFLLHEAHPDVLAAVAPVDILSFDISRDAQRLVDTVSTAVIQVGDDSTPTSVEYADGSSLTAPAFWFEMRGHDLLEHRVLVAYAGLNAHRDRLMDKIVERIWRTRPEVVPHSTVKLFMRLLGST